MTLPSPADAAFSAWTRREILALAFLLVGSALTLSFRLGQTKPTVAAELRCWKTVSEMTQTGEWLVPHRDGKPALNKPPLFYWAGAAISVLAGGASYATLRAPSVIAALALFLLTYVWGRSIGGPKMALVSAGVMAVSLKFYDLGRDGTFEMMLALFTNAALFTFDRMYWLGRRSLAPLLSLLFIAAFLTKASPALLIVGLPIVVFLVFRREIRRALTLPVALWTIVALALSLVWFGVMVIRVPGAWQRFFSEAALPMGIEGTSHTAEHFHPFFYFFSRFVAIFAVGSLLLPLVLWRGWQTRFWRDDPRLRFCGWIVTSLLVAFSCFPQKQQHYLLPLLPAYAILAADAAVWAADARSSVDWAWLGLPGIALAIAVVVCVIPLVFLLHIVLQVGLGSVMALCAVVVSLAGSIVWFTVKRKWREAGVAGVLAAWLLYAIQFGGFEVLRSEFATGEYKQRSDYDAAHWAKLKESYPFLVKVLHQKSRFVKKSQEYK
jgi:4-amino-4-deoxy-L-arabinose transferase-like glycosyltransferase